MTQSVNSIMGPESPGCTPSSASYLLPSAGTLRFGSHDPPVWATTASGSYSFRLGFFSLVLGLLSFSSAHVHRLVPSPTQSQPGGDLLRAS